MTHRFYADENLPFPVVEELRRLGHDVLTMYKYGTANQSLPDDKVLSLAIEKQPALLTTNRAQFIRLHRQSVDHGGIIACTFDPDFVGQAQRLTEAVGNVSNLTCQLIRVYRPS